MKQYNDIIKLAYQTPSLSIEQCHVETSLLVSSIKVSSSKPVEDESDIGFVKEETTESSSFWE